MSNDSIIEGDSGLNVEQEPGGLSDGSVSDSAEYQALRALVLAAQSKTDDGSPT